MTNKFIEILTVKDPLLLEKYKKSRNTAKLFLEKYQINFPDYTDHGIFHADRITYLASELLKEQEIENLTSDEIYVLLMGCLLHDIGMGISENNILNCINPQTYHEFFKKNPTKTKKEFLREYHHELSYSIIKKEFKEFGIPSEVYAEAIALIAKAHRKVELNNYDEYKIKFFVKTGSDFLCLPYLGCIIRIADELDLTKNRISELVLKYHPPKDEITKLEIEKHRANILVNFNGDAVIITSKCYNQYVFNALISLYNKIKQEIKYCQKVIRGIGRIENKNYTLTINRLKKNINTVGFSSKDIGFSIDIENTFNHFISHTLYDDPIIAVREAIQNAIDTCRYKKSHIVDFNPKINVILGKNKLIIEDNGMGMDDFIIKEFFGKLGNTYYKTQSLRSDFESIAEFGIGIFSYFLICDYYEIETKMRDKVPIKFKVNKDPNLNFYFYKEFFKKEEGTKITFYLNEKAKQEMSYENLIKNIKNFVKDVEFPLKIISDNKFEIIEKDDYNFLFEEEIKNVLKIPFLDKKSLLKLYTIKIENEKFRGILGIWVPINKSGDIETKGLYTWFRDHALKIEVSHKGIHVTDYKYESILRYVKGRINILNKTELNLSRNHFTYMNLIFNVLREFEFALISKVLKKYNKANMKNKFINFNRFFMKFIDSLHLNRLNGNEIFTNILHQFLYFRIYVDEDFSYLDSLTFLSEYKKFIILPIENIFSDIKNIDIIKHIYDETKIPILFTDYFSVDFHLFLILNKKIHIEIAFIKYFPYLIITQNDMTKERMKLQNLEIIKFNKSFILTNFAFKYRFLNESHPLIKFWIENVKLIDENNNLKELFLYLNKNLDDYNHVSSLESINKILSSINEIMSTNFILKEEDFPLWINEDFFSGRLD